MLTTLYNRSIHAQLAFVVGDIYYAPSVNCLNPKGKLYSKVCNVVAKKRSAGCAVKKQEQTVESAVSWDMACSLQALFPFFGYYLLPAT